MTGGNPGRLRVAPCLLAILVLCVAIEGALSLGDLPVLGDGVLRARVFELASFRPDLLSSGHVAYRGQSVLMFLSYSILHAGPAHLAVNMLTLLALGSSVIRRAGQSVFLEICLAAALGGAIGYALIGPADIPMVGASGALFGLAGALIGWEIAEARRDGASLLPALRLILLLVVLNAVLWWSTEGRLAWQAHLGGGLAGLALAVLSPGSPPRRA